MNALAPETLEEIHLYELWKLSTPDSSSSLSSTTKTAGCQSISARTQPPDCVRDQLAVTGQSLLSVNTSIVHEHVARERSRVRSRPAG